MPYIYDLNKFTSYHSTNQSNVKNTKDQIY